MIRNFARSSLATLALLGIISVSHSALAAELVKLEGKVSVNRGDGFEPAKQGMVLKAGDKVLVGEDAAASLIYADPGCVFEIAPASVVTVSEVGPCIPGQSLAEGKSVLVTPTQGTPSDDDDPDLTPLYIIGGGAVIGTAAFIITQADEKDNQGGGGDDDDGPGEPGPSPQ